MQGRAARWLASLLVLAVVAVLAGACDDGSDEAPTSSATPSATSTAPPTGSTPAGTTTTSVTRTGVLVRDNPGMPPGRWFLLSEAPGAPALTLEVGLTSATRCLEDTKVARCDALVPGTRVRVEGTLAGDRLDTATLEVLEVLERPSSAP